MAITNGYTTLEAVKERLGLKDDTEDDSILEAAIEAASRAIDDWTGRRFYTTSETRYFTADRPDLVFIDDLLTLTELRTDEHGQRDYQRVWEASDYDLEPYTGVGPKTRIAANPQGRYTFPTSPKALKVTGSWGYSASAPTAIREACAILAIRFYKRKDAPFGMAGSEQLGIIRVLPNDPDVKQLIQPYRRLEVF